MQLPKLLAVAAVAVATSAMSHPPASSVTVTIDSGPNAGTYSLANQSVPCTIQSASSKPKHSFYSQNGDESKARDPKALTIAYLGIHDADVTGANPTFYVYVNFGDTSHGTKYFVETRPGQPNQGTGTATLTTHGKDATVAFTGKTKTGATFHGKVECVEVVRY